MTAGVRIASGPERIALPFQGWVRSRVSGHGKSQRRGTMPAYPDGQTQKAPATAILVCLLIIGKLVVADKRLNHSPVGTVNIRLHEPFAIM